MEQFCSNHYLAPISARDVYAACHLKPTYGAILFRRHRGKTLTDHLTTLRIEHALQLLRKSKSLGAEAAAGGAICDVAFASGFRSLSRFYEAFTAHTGASPRNYLTGPSYMDIRRNLIDSAPATQHASHTPRLRALWVDDSPSNITEERDTLASSLGIQTDMFTSNAPALAALKSTRYDLVLSDIRRANSTETGWEFALALRSITPNMPLHLYTGFLSAERRKLAHKLAATSISTRSKDLLAYITRHLP